MARMQLHMSIALASACCEVECRESSKPGPYLRMVVHSDRYLLTRVDVLGAAPPEAITSAALLLAIRDSVLGDSSVVLRQRGRHDDDDLQGHNSHQTHDGDDLQRYIA